MLPSEAIHGTAVSAEYRLPAWMMDKYAHTFMRCMSEEKSANQ